MTSVGHHPLVGQRLRSADAAARGPRQTMAAVLAKGKMGDATVTRIDGQVARGGGVTAERSAQPPRISNAEEPTDRVGRSPVRAWRDDRESIAVMGGIATRDRTPLYRSSEQLTLPSGERRGTGSGLARTKRLVKLHGGTIGVESELGAGTTFTVRIPVA